MTESAVKSNQDSPLVRVQGVGKRYISYARPHHRLLQTFGIRGYGKEYWALQDIDLEIRAGETIGILGRNGAGKSTLLQILCGLVPPTTGELSVNARVAGLLELGAGFNAEFTGLENIYFKASLLGMSRVQVEEKMESILAFAEIGDFIDEPVKTYSSGMYVRLAFAVAVAVAPQILVIDEALAVGDAYFQRKCHRRIQELQEAGSTLLLVSHSTEIVERLCQRGIVIDQGRKVYDGPIRSAVNDYMKRIFGTHIGGGTTETTIREKGAESTENSAAILMMQGAEDVLATRDGYNKDEIRIGTGDALVADAYLAGRSGVPMVTSGQRVELWVKYVCIKAVSKAILGIKVRTLEGVLVYSTNSFVEHNELFSFEAGKVFVVRWTFDAHLIAKQYLLSFGMSQYTNDGQDIVALDRRNDAIVLIVQGDSGAAQGIANLRGKIELDATVRQVV